VIDTFEGYSQLSLFTAMAIYAAAFVLYSIDLATRSGQARGASAGGEQQRAGAGAAAAGLSRQSAGGSADSARGSVATLVRPPAAPAGGGSVPLVRRSKVLRVAFSLTVLGWLFQLAATILRGIDAQRVPFGNMYEFALTATTVIVGVFVVVQIFVDVRFVGALITGLALLFLGITRTNFYVPVRPLPPALDSYWLVLHILVAVLAVGLLTLAFGLAVAQLLQTRRESRLAAGLQAGPAFLATFPPAERLENLAYRVNIIGFIFWSFTLIAGAIWAEHAWGRYWGWDTKEVWTFIIWVLYAGYIHARATRGWRGTRASWLAIIAYAAVLFNFAIVNIFFKGLHAYSGL